jgi:hypothetical protein
MLRTTEFVMKTVETTLSYWRGLERSAESASQRISDFVHERSMLGRSTPKQPSTGRPSGRDVAVKHAMAPMATPTGRSLLQDASTGKAERGREKASREAIERGENEGMMVPSQETTARRRKAGSVS